MPQKDDYFATLKSTNYLVNALAVLDAEVEEYDQVRNLSKIDSAACK